MTLTINKELVKKRFNKNLESYKSEAIVQKEISAFLAAKIPLYPNEKFNSLLEIGCGSGFFTQEICTRFAPNTLYLNDLYKKAYHETINHISTINNAKTYFIEGDAETADLPAQLDGIFSTSCFQWFANLEQFLSKAHRLLNCNGLLAFSSFGNRHFTEIKQLTKVGLNYPTLDETVELVSRKFKIIYAQQWTQKEYFPSPIHVLKHIKLTGVNGINNGYFGREKLNKFTGGYLQQFSETPQEVYLTYHPVVVVAQKQ